MDQPYDFDQIKQGVAVVLEVDDLQRNERNQVVNKVGPEVVAPDLGNGCDLLHVRVLGVAEEELNDHLQGEDRFEQHHQREHSVFIYVESCVAFFQIYPKGCDEQVKEGGDQAANHDYKVKDQIIDALVVDHQVVAQLLLPWLVRRVRIGIAFCALVFVAIDEVFRQDSKLLLDPLLNRLHRGLHEVNSLLLVALIEELELEISHHHLSSEFLASQFEGLLVSFSQLAREIALLGTHDIEILVWGCVCAPQIVNVQHFSGIEVGEAHLRKRQHASCFDCLRVHFHCFNSAFRMVRWSCLPSACIRVIHAHDFYAVLRLLT